MVSLLVFFGLYQAFISLMVSRSSQISWICIETQLHWGRLNWKLSECNSTEFYLRVLELKGLNRNASHALKNFNCEKHENSILLCVSLSHNHNNLLHAHCLGTSLVQHLMTVLIREHQRLYSGREHEGPALPLMELPAQGHQLQHRSLGAWISEEDLQSGPGSNTEQELHTSASSLDTKLSAAITPNPNPGPKMAPSTGKGEPVVSPSKQAKTMPSWKYSFKSSSTPRSQPQAKQATTGATVADTSAPSGGGGNWLMNGLSSLRGHRRTSSGERSARDRDSTGSSQRLSTYDNVTSSSSTGSVPSVSSTPWSSSSCDISIPDSSGEPQTHQNFGGGADSDERTEWTESQRETEREKEAGRMMEPGVDLDGCEAMELCSSSAAFGESENVPMVAGVPSIIMTEDGDGTTLTLNTLVEELKEELRKQRTTYETRIQK